MIKADPITDHSGNRYLPFLACLVGSLNLKKGMAFCTFFLNQFLPGVLSKASGSNSEKTKHNGTDSADTLRAGEQCPEHNLSFSLQVRNGTFCL